MDGSIPGFHRPAAEPPPGRGLLAPWGVAGLLLLLVASGFAGSVHAGAPPGSARTAGPVGPVAGTFGAGAAPPALRPAAFVTNVAGITPAAIDLTWNATNDAVFSNYTVQRSDNGSAGPWRTVGVVTPQSATSFATGGLTPGANYAWRVVEHGLVGSQTAASANATQPALAELNVTMTGPNSARFNWTNNASYGGSLGFVVYTLYEASGGSGYASVTTVTNLSTLTATVTGLSASASYQFYLATTDCFAGCGTGSAQQSGTASNVVTLGTPQPLTVTLTAARSVVDLGQSDFFTCTPGGGAAPFQYAWTIGGTNQSGGSAVSPTLDAPGNTTVACTVRDALGSQSTAATVVTVRPYPTIAVAVDRSAADVGQSVGFTSAVSEGTAPYAIEWAFGDGTTDLLAVTAHAYGQAGDYVATCSATDASGATLASSLALNVSPALGASVHASFAGAAPGSAIPFLALPTAGSGSYVAYEWSFGDGQGAAGASVAHAFLAPANYTIALTVNDSNGASANATARVSIAPISIELQATARSVSTGDAVNFTARAAGGAGGYNYSWNFGDGSSGYGPAVRHVYAAPGSYRPSLRVRDALGASATANATALNVTVPPAAFPTTTLTTVLLVGLAVGLIVGLAAWNWERRRPIRTPPSIAGYVPATDPSTSIHGIKVCRTCGTANVTLRESCTHCGAPLPRYPSS